MKIFASLPPAPVFDNILLSVYKELQVRIMLLLNLKNISFSQSGFAILLALLTSCACADVYINEFMADNNNTILTADGTSADWIEIYNDGATETDISGWYLTDKSLELTKWQFPANTLIAPDSYLIVFADGSNVSVTNNELHTSFKLSDSGEYLALVEANGTTIVCEFAPEYPKQYEDVSYGLTQIQTATVDANTPARYKVPNASGTATWHSATGGLGFTDSISTFTVHYYEM
ncbi:MAG: lamin tail domain-containing protein, partial [Kiritimatiellae bacterium]|nr:lamin tail domain-containing protein [Kiritimatiellia bacterium]